MVSLNALSNLARAAQFMLPRRQHRRAVTACMALANIVKSSLGPVGLDKMLVRPSSASHEPCLSVAVHCNLATLLRAGGQHWGRDNN